MKFNIQTICHSNLLREVPSRTGDIIARRFGLKGGDKETLESIGQTYGLTRERVRQIQDEGLRKMGKRSEAQDCQNVFDSFVKELKASGSLKREDVLLTDLGGSKFQNHALFLLTLGNSFQRFSETKDFYAGWAVDNNSLARAKESIDQFTAELKKKKTPLSLPKAVPAAYIELSKSIVKSADGLYGLKSWPEVNPKGVKDKAYIVLKKEQKPLHFTKVAELINEHALPQTVHNELIKDNRFVLVGRGLYALKEWGYEPGVVRDVIARVLKTSNKPLDKEKVIDKVLAQRYVQPNTVLLNLQNRKYFLKTAEGYTVREA
ncbi:MAG: sigma factor-like helix-turn-helix DNA-binding protein [Candidatus Nealsonbacteria bacterium]